MEAALLSENPLEEIPFFASLPKEVWAALEDHLSICCYAPGERVVEEGGKNPGRLFVVLEGEVAVCNMGQSFSPKTMGLYQIATKGKNEVLGAVSFLDGEPYAVSFIAKTPLTVALLDFSRSAVTPCSRKLRAAVVSELRRQLTADLRSTLAGSLQGLQTQAEFQRYRNAVGSIVVTTLSLLSFYTLLLSVLPQFQVALTVNFALSPFIIALFAAVMGPVIWYSGFPRSFFGSRLPIGRAR
jgi:hypothetical protein